MGFESVEESISNKNNNGIKNLRQGLVYNRNKKKTKRNVIEGFKEGVDSATLSKYKSSDKPTKPWLTSGPYPGDVSGNPIHRYYGDKKQRLILDDEGNATNQYQDYRDSFPNYKGRFDDMRAKEFAQFEGALKKFNSAKKKYEAEYDNVATAHTGIEDNIRSCRGLCNQRAEELTGETINGMDRSAYQDKFKKFCQAGCSFKGPQFTNSCKDSWKGLKTAQQTENGNSYSVGASCSAFHDICDKNNNRISRGEHDNEVLNYKDTKGNKLKDTCCSCGGGSGGPPKYEIDGIHHKSCNSLKLHLCGKTGNECGDAPNELMSICNTPPMPSTGSGTSHLTLKQNLKTAYDNVVTNNNTMRDRGQFLFNKINKYDKQLKSLNNEKNNEEETYDEIISNYKDTREKLYQMYGITNLNENNGSTDPNIGYTELMDQKLKMTKDWSSDVMVEESKLRRRSEEMQFWMWSILAIVVGWATIINFRKKVA